MKWIKKFNEELKPEVYRRAGWGLQRFGKQGRAAGLIDYADVGEWGVFKMHYASYPNTIVQKNIECTQPTWSGFYFGEPKKLAMGTMEYPTYRDADELIKAWVEGKTSLSFTIGFSFKPLERERLKSVSPNIQRGGLLNMFSVVFELSDWSEGLDEYNTPERFGLEEGEELEKASVEEFYDNTTTLQLRLERPNDKYFFGIFADRPSALKFKKYYDETIEKCRDKIYDILFEVCSNPNEVDKVITKLKSIRINALYDDELEVKPDDIQKKWFFGKGPINK